MEKAIYEQIGKELFWACCEVHKSLGPGLLESVYSYCLIEELRQRGLEFETQFEVPLLYKGRSLGKSFFLDILIQNEVIVELKAVEHLLPVHDAQLLSYLKITNKKLGFLVNFNVALLKDGFKRKVNNY